MQSRVTVKWAGGAVQVEPGTHLSEALNTRGTSVETPCGGRGHCRKCVVRVVSGSVPPTREDRERLTHDEIAAGYRLACRLKVTSDIEVSVRPVQLALEKSTARASVGSVTDPWATGRVGFALDLGTTTIAGSLVDLTSGERIAAGTRPNPQAVHGADVMSRLAVALGSASGAASLQTLVVDAASDLLRALRKQAAIPANDVKAGVLVGNTAMHHLALGLDVASLSKAPYLPACKEAGTVDLPGLPPMYAVPVVAGFVGSDAVADAVATGLLESPKDNLLIDVGTNSEVLLSHGGTLYAASAPAGPAFEGGEISRGMKASRGAIDSARLARGHLDVTTIGDAPPEGICGSGLVDLVAALLEAGVLDEGGRMYARGPLAPQVLTDGTGATGFEVVPGVVLTQKDIRAFQLAKGAVRSAVDILLSEQGVSYTDLADVLLAGSFGSFLNRESALSTGLLPPVPASRVQPVGNAALAGAEMILLSTRAKSAADLIPRSAVHVELALRPGFQEEFLRSVQFPMAMPKGTR